ncbi:MAG TPA: 2-dehydropantoate 2-reductase N-terminal domain-containing protein [Bacteriovoracaceae bacterium]|nr:2-dehydropantoate 2-reductase N-terminal domain-containing protein [Bacteriovoracaceae bacterium]
MRILIVGAGAIGQVYAYHLKKAGNEVHFYVKEKYAAEMHGELSLYPLNRRNPRNSPVSFKADGVVTTPEGAGKSKWDQVYLCMSSTGLRGEWIDQFARAIPEATIISLQSGLEDVNYLLGHFPRERIVSGMLSLISYHAPLPGEIVPRPGMAFWYPPLSPSPFSGEISRTKKVVDALKKGGYPAKIAKDVPSMIALPSAVLMSLISGLELADWSFKKFNQKSKLSEVCQAANEAAQIISKKQNQNTPWAFSLLTPTSIRALMKLVPCVIPLDIETYLKVHFTKVGDQTRMYMKGYLDSGKGQGMAAPGLERLTTSLVGHRTN